MVEQLGVDHAITKRILGGATPAARAAELVDKTRLTDPEIRNLLRAGGRGAIDVSTDPFIVLARSLEPDAQAIAKKYEEQVTTVQAAAYPKIGQAVFVVYGQSAYPDATGTLRLSYGTVKGYMENGKKVTPYTTIAGLYQRAAEHAMSRRTTCPALGRGEGGIEPQDSTSSPPTTSSAATADRRW